MYGFCVIAVNHWSVNPWRGDGLTLSYSFMV